MPLVTMNNLTPQQRIDIVEIYLKKNCSNINTIRAMRKKYGRHFNVSALTIRKIVKKFRESGNVSDRNKPVKPRLRRSNENIERVRADVARKQDVSYRRRAQQLGMSGTTLRRILKEDLHLFPYKIQLTQLLLTTDKPRRLEYGRQMRILSENQADFWEKIIMSDEANFSLTGHVNKQNSRYWGSENPMVIHQQPLYDKKITVWCGMSASKIYGPFFFEDEHENPVTVNGARYRAMIEDFLWPQIQEDELQNVWFQQDGAPCHTMRETITLLNRLFPDRLISKNGTYGWPPRSPDLTSPDFYLWGFLKSRVYIDRPQTIQELKCAIRREIALITPETLREVMQNAQKRAHLCVVHGGDHLPDIIFKT